MNTKGQTVFFLFMLSLVIIILALALAGPLKELVDNARAPTSGDTLGLDCDNASISSFDKAACVTTDISIFYFIGGLIFITGIIISAKIIFG